MKIHCLTWPLNQWYDLANALDFLGLTESLAIPIAVVLSPKNSVGGWGYPIASRIFLWWIAIWPTMNWVQYSPSAIDATSLGVFFDTTSVMFPITLGAAFLSERKNTTPALSLACGLRGES